MCWLSVVTGGLSPNQLNTHAALRARSAELTAFWCGAGGCTDTAEAASPSAAFSVVLSIPAPEGIVVKASQFLKLCISSFLCILD